jgi:hypothetical protein
LELGLEPAIEFVDFVTGPAWQHALRFTNLLPLSGGQNRRVLNRHAVIRFDSLPEIRWAEAAQTRRPCKRWASPG